MGVGGWICVGAGRWVHVRAAERPLFEYRTNNISRLKNIVLGMWVLAHNQCSLPTAGWLKPSRLQNLSVSHT